MVRVIDANATYTGGGVYQYTGTLDNGNFFQTWTGWEDYIQELDTDPEENWDDNGYEEWQNEHMVVEHCGSEATEILKEVMRYIINVKPAGNYQVYEIEDALRSIENNHLEGKRVRIVFEDRTEADIVGEIVYAEDDRIHIVRD